MVYDRLGSVRANEGLFDPNQPRSRHSKLEISVLIFRRIVPTVTQNFNMHVVYSHDTGVSALDLLPKRCGLDD